MSNTYKRRKIYFEDDDNAVDSDLHNKKKSPRAKKKLTEAEVLELMMKHNLGG